MSQFPRCTITLFILLLLFPFAMSVIMASFYLDQLYHPKGDTIRTFGGTQSLFIQYLSGGGGGLRVWLWCMYVTATIVMTINQAN